MLTWKIWEGDAATWDILIMQFADYTIYQSYAWGEHRSHFGWVPYRLIATENNQTVAMAQVMLRRFPLGITLAWVNGGPIGSLEAWGKPFHSALQRLIGVKHLYCRVNIMKEQNCLDEVNMKSEGWLRPSVPFLSGRSLSYLPSENESIREAQTSRNWRHNLRRSFKYENQVNVWLSPDPDEIMSVYQSMQSHKNIAALVTRPVLTSILKIFDKQCVIVHCKDKQSNTLALRGTLIFGKKAWDIFAAATPQARKLYASHATFWELMRQCTLRDVQWYDMGGADPLGNKGVYDFKKGTGAKDLLFLGEWEWATSSLLRHAANFLIKCQSGSMQ
jgi:hypothetical protein